MDQWEVTSSTGHGSPCFHVHYSGTNERDARRAYRQAVMDMEQSIATGMVEGQALVSLIVNDDIEKQKGWY